MKSIVPESTFGDGYAVLNADDDLVYNMKENLSCNIALFSGDHTNQRLAAHCAAGGPAAFVENGWLVISKGYHKTPLAKIEEIPVTLGGKCGCMVQNALAAVLAATLSGFPASAIKKGLDSFFPSPQLNPGRMNIFDLPHCKVILDYAHNVGGYMELQKFLARETASKKIGIIGATGDRREQDIISLGELAAEIFDEIIIRHDKDGRGRTNEELSMLLMKGIRLWHPGTRVRIISDEKEALMYAIKSAEEGSLIFLSSDNVHESLSYLEEITSLEQPKPLSYGT